MERKEDTILLDGPEAVGLLATGKNISFSRTDSFSGRLVRKPLNSEETQNILNGKDKSHVDNPQSDEDGNGSNHDNEEAGEKGEKKCENSKPKEFVGWKRYLGMGLAILASALFSLTTVIVKALKDYHVFSIGLWRFQGVLLPSLPIILHAMINYKERNIFEPIHPICKLTKLRTFLYLFLRAFFGCCAVLLHFNSLKYMNISDATVIAFCTPVFVTFLAHFLLGESCGIVNIISAFVTLLGVGIITRPPFLTGEESMDVNLLTGAGFALGAMLCSSLTFLALRLLKGVHYSVVTFFFGTYGSIECIILSLFVGYIDIPRGDWDWFLAVVLALLTFVGQVCSTLSLQYEEAGPIALCRTCDVIFSFIWQFIFFSVTPSIFSFLGALVVLTGVMLIAFRKYLFMLPEKHPSRKRFWFVLK